MRVDEHVGTHAALREGHVLLRGYERRQDKTRQEMREGRGEGHVLLVTGEERVSERGEKDSDEREKRTMVMREGRGGHVLIRGRRRRGGGRKRKRWRRKGRST